MRFAAVLAGCMAVGVLLAGVGGVASMASAQTPVPAGRTGVVSGSLRNGTAGAALPDIEVQLIVVARQGAVTSVRAVAADARFRFEVPADPAVTYLLRTEYLGVAYIDPAPILLSPEASTVSRDLTVYEVTREQPALRIVSTVVSVQGVDPAQGRVHLERRDTVVSAGDRVYIGGADGVTLRSPAPEGILEVAVDQGLDGRAAVEGQTVTSTQPLRPGETVVVTDLVAGYDPGLDQYRVRVMAPLPAARLEVRVPKQFAGRIEAGAGGVRGAEIEADGERWSVVERRGPVREGESLLVTLHGLSGRNAPNPLAVLPGAGIAAALAFVVVVLGVAVGAQLRRRAAAADREGRA